MHFIKLLKPQIHVAKLQILIYKVDVNLIKNSEKLIFECCCFTITIITYNDMIVIIFNQDYYFQKKNFKYIINGNSDLTLRYCTNL